MVEPSAIFLAHASDHSVPIGILFACQHCVKRGYISYSPNIFQQFAIKLLHVPTAIAEEKSQMAVSGIAVVHDRQDSLEISTYI